MRRRPALDRGLLLESIARKRSRLPALLGALLLALPVVAPAPVWAQSFTLDDVLSPGFAYDLRAARAEDRIVWLENERGMRNVYTAEAPDFVPVRLTSFLEDDGQDLVAPQISDDGAVVVFTRGHEPNREGWVANPRSDPAGGERAAWAISTDGGEPWRVVQANEVSLSPDGRWVLYMKAGQVHRAPVNPGLDGSAGVDEAAPLFRAYGEIREPSWSPDGSKVAFVTDRETHSFVGVYDIATRRVSYMTPSVDWDYAPAWSPDGERLAFIRRPGRPFGETAERSDTIPVERVPPGFLEARFAGGHDRELWIAEVETGQGHRLWKNRPEDEESVDPSGLTWAGTNLVFWAEPEDWRRYFSIPTASPDAEPVPLTHAHGLPEHVAFSPDGSHLYFATNHADIDRRHIWRVATAGGEPIQLTTGDGVETYPVVLASGERLALLSAGARQPQSVAVTSVDGGSPQLVTRPPERFPASAHVEPENVVLTAADGVEFHNQLFLPPDLGDGEQRPALIFMHGGPRRQMLLGYNYLHFYHMAYAVNQYFANKGYVVLSVNYRGGIGYGEEFRTAERMGRQGMEEYQDILAAGRYLETRPDVDPQRIALWGLSYGGILTANALARNSDLFVAGADLAGVHFWGDTLDPEATTYSSSAASEIERWTSPVLLVHGDDDRNVEFSQTVGLVQLLRAHEVPYELIVFPDEVHSFLVHEHWMETFRAMDDFFDRKVMQGEGVRAVDSDGGRPEYEKPLGWGNGAGSDLTPATFPVHLELSEAGSERSPQRFVAPWPCPLPLGRSYPAGDPVSAGTGSSSGPPPGLWNQSPARPARCGPRQRRAKSRSRRARQNRHRDPSRKPNPMWITFGRWADGYEIDLDIRDEPGCRRARGLRLRDLSRFARGGALVQPGLWV